MATLLLMGFKRVPELEALITKETFEYSEDTVLVDETTFHKERDLDIEAWEKKY
jgi:hypothetical protein